MSSKRRIYKEPRPVTRAAAEAAFGNKNTSIVCDALIGVAYHDPDWEWVQGKCLEFLRHENPDVRGLAATCLGHVARIHRRLDVATVKRALAKLLKDPLVSGRAQDALDDVAAYIK